MNVFHDKCFLFLVSGGRTATRFFGSRLQDVIENCRSVHDPDVLAFNNGGEILAQFRSFGLYHMTLGRILGRTGIRNLSQNYLAGRLTLDELCCEIANQRERFYQRIPEELIVESYSGWYGCIPAIRKLCTHYRLVIIVRDPRDWVISQMNWGALFGRDDWVSRLGYERLTPELIGDSAYRDRWRHFSRLEKLCWTWKTQYEIMLKDSHGDANARTVRFEDIFHAENRYRNLREMLEFATGFGHGSFPLHLDESLLDSRLNAPKSRSFPPYPKWSPTMKAQLMEICLPLMEKLGYSLNE